LYDGSRHIGTDSPAILAGVQRTTKVSGGAGPAWPG
jgi:hypothetical protein